MGMPAQHSQYLCLLGLINVAPIVHGGSFRDLLDGDKVAVGAYAAEFHRPKGALPQNLHFLMEFPEGLVGRENVSAIYLAPVLRAISRAGRCVIGRYRNAKLWRSPHHVLWGVSESTAGCDARRG